MHGWLKTCCARMQPLAVRLIHSPVTPIVTIILLGSTAFAQSDSERLGMSANELARNTRVTDTRAPHGRHAYDMSASAQYCQSK